MNYGVEICIQFNNSLSTVRIHLMKHCIKRNGQWRNHKLVREELLGLVRELPVEFEKIASKTKSLEDARCFYHEFTKFVSPTHLGSQLPLLKYIIEHGDVTVYEWKYGEAPISIEKQESNFEKIEAKDKEENGFVVVDSTIDFGSLDNLDTIDFSDINLNTGDIDWGTLDTPPVDDAPSQIDWDISEVDASEIDSSQIVLESSGVEGGVAQGNDALSLLSNETTRNQFIYELLELEGFLSHRCTELNCEDSVLAMSQFSTAPKCVQYQNKDQLSEYLVILKNIIQDISSTKMQHLYLISTSSRYVDRLADSIQAKLRENKRLLSSVKTLQSKRNEAIIEDRKLASHLQLIIARTKELQKNIEEQISLKYKNRPVNLMGGIQNI